MPLEETKIIDAIARKKDKVYLIITDSGETSDPDERLKLFKNKLAYYASCIVSKEFNIEHSVSKENAVVKLICANPPTESMKTAKVLLEGEPLKFEYEGFDISADSITQQEEEAEQNCTLLLYLVFYLMHSYEGNLNASHFESLTVTFQLADIFYDESDLFIESLIVMKANLAVLRREEFDLNKGKAIISFEYEKIKLSLSQDESDEFKRCLLLYTKGFKKSPFLGIFGKKTPKQQLDVIRFIENL